VVSVCRRWLVHAETSRKLRLSRRSFRHGWRSAAGDASDENQDRYLQGREAQRHVSEHSISTSSIRLFGPGWSTLRDNTLFWGFNPAFSASALKAHAGGDAGTETSDIEADLPMDEIARQINPLPTGMGSNTTDDTAPRLCTHCSDMSSDASGLAMRKFSGAFKAPRPREFTAFLSKCRRKSGCSYTGGLV